jgi:hypothetical protein
MKNKPRTFRPNEEVESFIKQSKLSLTELVNLAIGRLIGKCPLCGSKVKVELEAEESTKEEVEDFGVLL